MAIAEVDEEGSPGTVSTGAYILLAKLVPVSGGHDHGPYPR